MMLHASIGCRPSARARAMRASDSDPGLNQTSAIPFAARPSSRVSPTSRGNVDRGEIDGAGVVHDRRVRRFAFDRRVPRRNRDHAVAGFAKRPKRLVAELLAIGRCADDRDGLHRTSIGVAVSRRCGDGRSRVRNDTLVTGETPCQSPARTSRYNQRWCAGPRFRSSCWPCCPSLRRLVAARSPIPTKPSMPKRRARWWSRVTG